MIGLAIDTRRINTTATKDMALLLCDCNDIMTAGNNHFEQKTVVMGMNFTLVQVKVVTII